MPSTKRMTGQGQTKATAQQRDSAEWQAGALGRDLAHAMPISAEVAATLDQPMKLQLISMRLPADMIDSLKRIAATRGMGYQTLARAVLAGFVEEHASADAAIRARPRQVKRAQAA
jgi:predicted DNA binding CopG/RHH family protein